MEGLPLELPCIVCPAMVDMRGNTCANCSELVSCIAITWRQKQEAVAKGGRGSQKHARGHLVEVKRVLGALEGFRAAKKTRSRCWTLLRCLQALRCWKVSRVRGVTWMAVLASLLRPGDCTRITSICAVPTMTRSDTRTYLVRSASGASTGSGMWIRSTQRVCCRDATWKSGQKKENNFSKISLWLEEADSVRAD